MKLKKKILIILLIIVLSIVQIGFSNLTSLSQVLAVELLSDDDAPTFKVDIPRDRFYFVEGDKLEVIPTVTVTSGDFHPVNLVTEFDPSTDDNGEHPDYVKYQWHDQSNRQNGYVYWPNPELTTRILTMENVQYRQGGQYYLQVIPMKWDSNENEYKEIKKGDQKVFGMSKCFGITIYPKLQLDLLGEDPLTKNEDGTYSLNLSLGESYKVNTHTYRNYTYGKSDYVSKVVWSTDSQGIVDVDQDGTISVKSNTKNNAKITASVTDINGKATEATINVSIVEAPVDRITLNADSIDLKVGEEYPLIVTYEPEYAVNKNVTWSIKDNGDQYIEVNDGVVKAKSLNNGQEVTATVVATTGNGKTAECQVNVKKTYVTDITANIEESDITLVGDNESTMQIKANVYPETSTVQTITWTTTDSNVATVTAADDGTTATIKAGYYNVNGTNTCKIIAEAEGSENPGNKVKREYTIYLLSNKLDVGSIEISAAKTNIAVGESVDLDVTVNPSEATVKSVTWSIVSGDDVISINDSGLITGLKEGVAEVQAEVACQNPNCPHHRDTITINVNKVPVDAIGLNRTHLTLVRGESEQLEATVLPTNATYKTVSWTSSNSDIATVENGKVVAKTVGECTITATADGKTAVCYVTVVKKALLEISFDQSEEGLKLKDNDEPFQLFVNKNPDDADISVGELVWISRDENVATVDQTGKLTPIKEGQTVITVYSSLDSQITASIRVTVVPAFAKLVVYTVDQNKNLISGMTLSLSKLDENGIETEPNEILGDGKFEINNLSDGTYVLRVSESSDINITQTVDYYEFFVIDGKAFFEGDDEAIAISSLLFINTSDGTEARVEIGEYYKIPDEDDENDDVTDNEEPTVPEQSERDDNNTPSTSDVNIEIFIASMIIAFIGIITLVFNKRKKFHKKSRK